ncbi:Hmr-1p [Parelaphostrongylus tenuis]|uniref:Hmr-1p n=1 Tax=Parelaphostrongylus tenuis TaxID=148309 RepID=A0AAD5MRF9_PARTN|nr:Hmr-1p [Parelaphostrongylus tenuis]
MDVRATDYDDPTSDNARLDYSIILNKEIDGLPVFRIDPSSGKIFAMVLEQDHNARPVLSGMRSLLKRGVDETPLLLVVGP